MRYGTAARWLLTGMMCLLAPVAAAEDAKVSPLMAKDLAVGSDLDLPVGVFVDVNVAVNQAAVGVAVLEQVDDPVVLQRER